LKKYTIIPVRPKILKNKGKFSLALCNNEGIVWETIYYNDIEILKKIGYNLLKANILMNGKEYPLIKQD